MVKILKPSYSNRKDDDSNKKKKKKKSKLQPDSIAMKKVKATKLNPFETIWSRRKFDILGKKRKGETRRLGLARSLAIEKVLSSIPFIHILHICSLCICNFRNCLYILYLVLG